LRSVELVMVAGSLCTSKHSNSRERSLSSVCARN
jgi:hypothetical protein